MEGHKCTGKRAQTRKGGQGEKNTCKEASGDTFETNPALLNTNSLSVICALHKHGRKDGMTTWQLKKAAKLHERTVARALCRLATDGRYIQVSGKTIKNGSIYTLTDNGQEIAKKTIEVR